MIINDDIFNFIGKINSGSVDLILTDPPYDISSESNFHKVSNAANHIMKTKYSNHSIDFGEWDTGIDFDFLFSEFYRVLRKGGTLIVFYDIWKSNKMKEYGEKHKFKQLRVGQWIKNNPVPINSKTNYLSNSSEYFFTFTKDKNPTFNSEYDNATYHFPLCHGKERLDHPTQKPIRLINELLIKHSNDGDLVFDPFSGTGTLAESCIINDRKFICVERDEKYYNLSIDRIKQLKIYSI